MTSSAATADLHPPLSAPAKAALVHALEFLNEMVLELKSKDARARLPWNRNPAPLTEEQVHALIAQVSESAHGNALQMQQVEFWKWLDTLAKALKPWLAHPDVRLAHLVKLLYGLRMLGEAEGKRPDFYGDARELLNA